MAARKMTRQKQTMEVTPDNAERYLSEYLSAKAMADDVTARVNKMKANLNAFADAHGEPDEKGSIWVEVGEHKIKRERRVSTSTDFYKAEAWLRKNGRWDEFKIVQEVLDEDKLLAAGFEGTIPRKTFDSFTVIGETFAFKVL